MTRLLSPNLWWAEALRLRRQPLAWITLCALLLALLASALPAGLAARAWRQAAAQDAATHAARLQAATAQWRAEPGPAATLATYQLGRGDLGATRMPVQAGLALGVHRLDVLPVRLKASLDSRHVDARDPGPLRNPLLAGAGLPGLPAMVALLLPLAALVLCAGLLQEEREQGRLDLLRVQSAQGLWPVMAVTLGWRFAALWLTATAATLPSLGLDPGASAAVALQWVAGLGGLCAVWVAFGGLLSWLPVSGATAMLTALGAWLLLTFAVPAGLVLAAQREAPLPSRLAAILEIREAQMHGEDHEAELAQAWYARHPEATAQGPVTWPASFVPRVLAQDRRLRPLMQRFADSRARQAAFVERWSWLSPGLALVLQGERLAGTDAQSHVRYLRKVDAFEDRWRDALVPAVMNRQGLPPQALARLPRFEQGGGP